MTDHAVINCIKNHLISNGTYKFDIASNTMTVEGDYPIPGLSTILTKTNLGFESVRNVSFVAGHVTVTCDITHVNLYTKYPVIYSFIDVLSNQHSSSLTYFGENKFGINAIARGWDSYQSLANNVDIVNFLLARCGYVFDGTDYQFVYIHKIGGANNGVIAY